MKRTTSGKKEPQKNTLFSYFASTKAPPKKEPLSSLIQKTDPRTLSQAASNPSKARNQRRAQQPIDLTNDTDQDDDIIMISSQRTVIDLESSQGSYRSTSSSQSSMNRLNTTEMVNSSKYNKKGWSVEAKQRGPLSSSQDSRLSQEKKPAQRFERLQLNKPRITAKPSYDWLGPNDVKPYSSNYSPFVSAADHLKDDAPRITSQFDRPGSQPYSSSSSSSGVKRGWSDYDDSPSSPASASSSSTTTSTFGSSWNSTRTTTTKRRTLPTGSKDTGWSSTKAKPGNARQGRTKDLRTLGQLAALSSSGSNEFTPELSDEQKRVFGGIGIGEGKKEELAAAVEFNKRSSDRWKETVVLIIDETFVRILNEMRLGILSEQAISIFKSLSRKPVATDEIQPTELYPLRHEVDSSNKRRLVELRGEQIEFNAFDDGDSRKLQQCIAPAKLQLKLHAQVMLLKNMDGELVNGSLGVVVGFVGKGNYRNKEECEFLRTPQRKRDRNSLFAAGKEGDGELDMSTPWPVVKFSNGKEVIIEREAWSVAMPASRFKKKL
ncbi:hypothetical protein MUCCIDRAFT_163688 [Mucor lusitanicus CBS 277.49]|uniref:DNA helicase Pif1-like 2B domain-containing protein n=1 Tax=Mucor lusitanicus CBS 277.49 TaxID=747725 RepID=A0A162QFZ3_MUCCL|nr:hypothetical protein MUCCIDRAFT_163688 [Mucor lusitanicus CBS 277.49]